MERSFAWTAGQTGPLAASVLFFLREQQGSKNGVSKNTSDHTGLISLLGRPEF
jgi:hypothetical protein